MSEKKKIYKVILKDGSEAVFAMIGAADFKAKNSKTERLERLCFCESCGEYCFQPVSDFYRNDEPGEPCPACRRYSLYLVLAPDEQYRSFETRRSEERSRLLKAQKEFMGD